MRQLRCCSEDIFCFIEAVGRGMLLCDRLRFLLVSWLEAYPGRDVGAEDRVGSADVLAGDY